MKTIVIHNLDNHPTKPYQEFIDLQGDFKTYTEIKKLAERIADVGFKYDFYTWESSEETEHNGVTYPSGTCFIVDAHARQRALQFLERDGYKVPPVPYTRIQADSLEDAKLEILYLNSRYGEIQPTSEFLTELQGQLPEVVFESVVIPEFSLDPFLDNISSEDSQEEEPYSRKIEAPIYEITGDKPEIHELVNTEKSDWLIKAIKNSSLPEEEKTFLIRAAYRHDVFDFGKIAEYYAHSKKETQERFEDSTLIIIDFNKAIEQGYSKLAKDIEAQYLKDYPDEA